MEIREGSVSITVNCSELSLFYSLISSDLTRMTDSERDQIDQDAQIFMRTCSEAIKQLRNEGEVCFYYSTPYDFKYYQKLQYAIK